MLSNRKGLALLLVIGFILIFLTLGAAAITISTGHFGISHNQIRRMRAYFAAEAGIQHALWRCRTGGYDLSAGDNETITVSDPNYSFDVVITLGPPNAQGLNPISAQVDY